MATFRNYIAKNYDSIRTSPATITIRETEFINPTLIATYSYGIEKKVALNKKSE